MRLSSTAGGLEFPPRPQPFFPTSLLSYLPFHGIFSSSAVVCALVMRPAARRLPGPRWLGSAAKPAGAGSGDATATPPADTAAPLGGVTVLEWAAARVQRALGTAFGPVFGAKDACLTLATRSGSGDYQCNAALSLAKPLGLAKPRDVAVALLPHLDLAPVFDPPTIAGSSPPVLSWGPYSFGGAGCPPPPPLTTTVPSRRACVHTLIICFDFSCLVLSFSFFLLSRSLRAGLHRPAALGRLCGIFPRRHAARPGAPRRAGRAARGAEARGG